MINSKASHTQLHYKSTFHKISNTAMSALWVLSSTWVAQNVLQHFLHFSQNQQEWGAFFFCG